MEYSSTEKYQSYFGIYNIDGIKVEVMGDFQYKLKNGNWSFKNHLHDIYYVKYGDISIPVLSLEQELEEYEHANKIVTIEAIKRKLTKK